MKGKTTPDIARTLLTRQSQDGPRHGNGRTAARKHNKRGRLHGGSFEQLFPEAIEQEH